MEKLCFVIMGFGKKTDYETGRTLDLNATYEAIIKPAATQAGLRCIRADEVMHTGVIDLHMYEMLLRADVVVADISTGNVNAVYELGVRHALRPFSTIIMQAAEGKLHFDLNHINTFEYRHLGEDIGFKEAKRATEGLAALLEEAIRAPRPDSPVYTFLPRLRQPQLTDEEFRDLIEETEANEERLFSLLRNGEEAMRSTKPADARKAFEAASRMRPEDPYILQQLALATYKSKEPSPIASLVEALKIVERLSPKTSNDPETLGIAGAIHKRLWGITGERKELDLAIVYYGRGFDVRRDYYNGENLATCHDMRAVVQEDADEATYDRISARKVRETLVGVLEESISSPEFAERSDRKWVYATYANVSFALGRDADGTQWEAAFLGEDPATWEVDTYLGGKAAVRPDLLQSI